LANKSRCAPDVASVRKGPKPWARDAEKIAAELPAPYRLETIFGPVSSFVGRP
jgi:hypothetical protein